MIKTIIIFICIFISPVYSMQKSPSHTIKTTQNSLTILPASLMFPSQTKITITKQSLFEASKNTGIIVVGKNQQKISSPGLESFDIVGEIYSFLEKPLYEKNKDDDSASDDDTYKPYPYHPGQQRKPIKITQLLSRHVLVVTEPRITESFYIDEKKAITNLMYDVIRKNECLSFTGNEAITQASKDLASCYKKALNRGLTILRYNVKEKIIFFPTLSADVGFPRDKAARIAVETVFEFIKNNPKAYNNVTFFVKRRSDEVLYRNLLLQKTKLFHNMYLFYWGHKDGGTILSWLPMDVIDYIVKLTGVKLGINFFC